MADKGVPCTDKRSRKGYHEPRYDERGWHCEFCGNGNWKLHAPWCQWQDAQEAK